MHMKNRAIALQTALALLAGSLMIGEAARTLQFQPEPSAQDLIDSTSFSLGSPDSNAGPSTVLAPPAPAPSSSLSPHDAAHDAPSHSSTYTGTILRLGAGYVLRDPSGSLYRLDAPLMARPYLSRLVRVTGDFKDSDNLLHIEQIENLPA